MAKSDNLRKAKAAKNDEHYTKLDDIVAEIVQHPDYVKHFKDKVVFCNCDDPEASNFVKCFRMFFNKLGIKKMIATHYTKDGSPSYKLEWSGEKLNGDTVNMIKTPLEGDGDFRSPECIELLKEADIVVTNPPFSLYREYIALLEQYGKDFVIIGSMNSIAYKEVFPLLKEGRMFVGYTNPKEFVQPDGSVKKFGNITWFTNLDIDKNHEPLPLTKLYHGNEAKYPRYENFDGIDVAKVSDIPKDYDGIMGVPITFLSEYCPDQFEVLGLAHGNLGVELGIRPYDRALKPLNKGLRDGDFYFFKDGNPKPQIPYSRVAIRRKRSA